MDSRVKRGRRGTLRLPPEICAKICQDVGRKDLVTLCRTSRMFGAQWLIYHTVDLSHRTSRALHSWCLAVMRHSRLAERVHALSLGLSRDLSFSSDAEKIAHALSKCVNLKELAIHHDDSGPFGALYESQMSSIQGWIITKCPFRLTKFSNSYFKNSFLAQFWTPQSEIRSLPVDRPLQRIQLRWGRNVVGDLDQLSSLAKYSATLTTLNLLQTSFIQRISTRQIFDTVSQGLPGLLHLGITETGEYTKANQILTPSQVADRFSEDSPTGALAKFPQLETFVIYCQTISGFHDYELDRTYEFGYLPSLQTFGLAIMKAYPTLCRADIGSHISPATDVWYAGSKKRELACTVTRSPDGDIESVCATQFDFHAVGMFW
ncbi:hypothetical protein B0H14DRAFT_3036653 [Mycena olivaceomarginata]|nr:hypothetical protein B0H14DRAFT_3036653 [Mycena olivaceomarginata]